MKLRADFTLAELTQAQPSMCPDTLGHTSAPPVPKSDLDIFQSAVTSQNSMSSAVKFPSLPFLDTLGHTDASALNHFPI